MTPGSLSCAGVAKTLGGRRVLDGVSIEVHSGEVHALLGPSGAGKTTLLRILNMLEAPDEGTVTFNTDAIALSGPNARLTPVQSEARLKMALVPQKPIAFRTTVFENAAFGLRVRGVPKEEVPDRVRPALEKLGIAALADRPAHRLSGGETQRLAFARATVLPLEFLLLDEFTANLDPPNVKALEQAAGESAHERGLGVLFVTHDLFQARRIADRVSLLVDGRIVESAPKAEFFEAPQHARAKAFVAGELSV